MTSQIRALPLILLLAWARAWAGTMTVDVLDVGQGDSILLQSPGGKSVLIDAGDGDSGALAQIQAIGVQKLDLVVATHAHADHIGAMADVLKALPVAFYTDSGVPHTTLTYERTMRLVEDQKLKYRTAETGQVFNLDDGIAIQVLLPGTSRIRTTSSEHNVNSVVLRVTHGEDCFLFTGDAEEDTEWALLRQGLQPCGVLKVAHHGSKYATTQPFLDAVKPKIAVVSVGAGNNYGHPAPEAMDRLQSAGVEVHRTDLEGRIRLKSEGHGVTVSAARIASSAPATALASAESSESARAFAPTGAPDESASCPFVASSKSSVFHKPGCRHAAKIAAANHTCYATREEALAAGDRPCKSCKP